MHIMENISIIGGEFIMLKDLFKKAAAVLVSAASVFALSATAFAAADNTVSFDVSAAPVIEPWSSYAISMEHYDPTKITSASEVIVNFTYEEVTPVAEGSEKECPIELIVQSWSFPDTPMANSSGGVWAKVAPYEWDDTHAKFSYDDMVAAYGTADFSGVDALNIGATANANLTVQSCTITNCEDNMYIKMTDAERAEAYKTALIVVLASALAVIVIIIVVFLIILKRKSSYTYDVATGKYVKIEKNKK